MKSPTDRFSFGTKATTLERLAGVLHHATLCEQIVVRTADWVHRRERLVDLIIDSFSSRRLAVRSSAANEDGWNQSMAGVHLSYVSVPCVAHDIAIAVDGVFASYTEPCDEDEVLVQPMVEAVVISGVVVTRELNTGSPYYTINYDDFSGRTDTVTGGSESKTLLVHRGQTDALKSHRFRLLIQSVLELESVTGSSELDIEFCITRDDGIYILQVRPLTVRKNWHGITDSEVDDELNRVRRDIAAGMAPESGLFGERAIYGEMPDWNPAEMIGNMPQPLAYSLYANLITDNIWAQARTEMGYRSVNGRLMTAFGQRPYIDVRKSFNSFLPSDVDAKTGERLVNHQVEQLAANNSLHDKIEFEIALTCVDLAFEQDIGRLVDAGLNEEQQGAFTEQLHHLTGLALGARAGGIRNLLGQSARLNVAQPSDLSDKRIANLSGILEKTRRWGTLPFAILSRHGFIAIQFLRSLERRGVFGAADIDAFMQSVDTIASDLVHHMRMTQCGEMTSDELMARYGHLRPGTYDILSWRYDERPDLYLGQGVHMADVGAKPFALSDRQRADIGTLLVEAQYDIDADGLLDYIEQAVKAREEAKFNFTRAISDTLSVLTQWGDAVGLSREEVSFLPLETIMTQVDDAGALREAVAKGREKFHLAQSLRLPHLILEPSDIDVVRLPLGKPTFITLLSVTAKRRRATALRRCAARSSDFSQRRRSAGGRGSAHTRAVGPSGLTASHLDEPAAASSSPTSRMFSSRCCSEPGAGAA